MRIRECLEGAPLKQAVELIHWAIRRDPINPYKPLRNWARLNQRGYYSPEVRRLDSGEHHKRFLFYIRRKEKEKLAATGRTLFQTERVGLARDYYAPGYRVEMYLASQAYPVAV